MRHKRLQLLLLAEASRAEFPCASSYYRGRTIEKRHFAAGARGRLAYVAGLEHTGHHLWHDGVFKQPGPWRNAYDAYDVENGSQPPRHRRDFMPATTTTMDDAIDVTRHDCADDAKLERALRGDLARTQGDVLLHLPSCSYPCGTPPSTWDPDLPWLAAATEAAGFDFRVIVATRRPRDIVRDPDNGFTAERITTLTRSCWQLHAQLRRLDPRFLVCAQYPGAYLCGNQNLTARSSTPSTRRFLDGVAMSVPHRSMEPARPCCRREMT